MELKEQKKKRKITTKQIPSSLLGLICTFLPYAILVFGIVKGIKKGSGFQQPKSVSNEAIYKKLKNLESEVKSGTQIQKFGILYALGVAFVILGFSLWPGLLEILGLDPTRFYANSIVFIVLGITAMIYAYTLSRQKKNKG